MGIAGASATLRSLNQSFLVIIFILVKKKVPFIEKSANRLALQIVLLRNSCPVMFCKKVFLKFLQNSLENICVRVAFFTKLQALQKRLLHGRFLVNFAKFLRKPFYRTPLGSCSFLIETLTLVWVCLIIFWGRRIKG